MKNVTECYKMSQNVTENMDSLFIDLLQNVTRCYKMIQAINIHLSIKLTPTLHTKSQPDVSPFCPFHLLPGDGNWCPAQQ